MIACAFCDTVTKNVRWKGIAMTELEILKHAKMYIDKLANGIDPITDHEVPEGDIVNNVRLARCFFSATDRPGHTRCAV